MTSVVVGVDGGGTTTDVVVGMCSGCPTRRSVQRSSAVIGRPRNGDEEVLAFVQCSAADKPDPDELRRFVAGRLAGYKRPGRIVLTDKLPAAPTGKILKHKLLSAFADVLDQD